MLKKLLTINSPKYPASMVTEPLVTMEEALDPTMVEVSMATVAMEVALDATEEELVDGVEHAIDAEVTAATLALEVTAAGEAVVATAVVVDADFAVTLKATTISITLTKETTLRTANPIPVSDLR